jgi:hypothetical protein
MKYSSWFYKKWMKFLTWFGDLYCATEPPKVKEEQIAKAFFYLQTGDIIQRKYKYYADSYFIKGKYSHSAFCRNRPKMGETCIVEEIAEGINNIGLVDFIKDCDGFRILRPKYKRLADIPVCIARVNKYEKTILNMMDFSILKILRGFIVTSLLRESFAVTTMKQFLKKKSLEIIQWLSLQKLFTQNGSITFVMLYMNFSHGRLKVKRNIINNIQAVVTYCAFIFYFSLRRYLYVN